MKKFAALCVAGVLLGLLPARAQGPDEQYVQIYNLIQEGDGLNRSGQVNRGLQKYLEAQTALQRFQRGYPDWNPQVIKFRLGYLEDKVKGQSQSNAVALPSAKPAAATPTKPAPADVPAVKAPPPSDAESQLGGLQEQVRQLQAEKSVLEAKLKESLSAQPAAIESA